MTQRIFDVDNPQDVKDLFDVLPDEIKTVIKDVFNNERIEFYNKDRQYIDSCAYIRVNWRDQKEITRPVDESKWIGCLCWFWSNSPEHKCLDFLKSIDITYHQPYETSNGLWYINCCPARRDEIKFVEDME